MCIKIVSLMNFNFLLRFGCDESWETNRRPSQLDRTRRDIWIFLSLSLLHWLWLEVAPDVRLTDRVFLETVTSISRIYTSSLFLSFFVFSFYLPSTLLIHREQRPATVLVHHLLWLYITKYFVFSSIKQNDRRSWMNFDSSFNISPRQGISFQLPHSD